MGPNNAPKAADKNQGCDFRKAMDEFKVRPNKSQSIHNQKGLNGKSAEPSKRTSEKNCSNESITMPISMTSSASWISGKRRAVTKR